MRFIFFILSVILLNSGCTSNQINLSDSNTNLQSQLKKYDEQVIKELSGTWRLYKESFYLNQEPELVSRDDNDYIIIKEDFTFKTAKGSGKIGIAYSSIQNSEVETNFILTTYATYNGKTFWQTDDRYRFYKTYMISIIKNSKVRELKMANLQDSRFKVYRED